MNSQKSNELKFQLILILRQTIWHLGTIVIFSIFLAMANIMNLDSLEYGYSNKSIYYILWLVAILANINVALTNGYKETAAYFLEMGYTRKKYYRGNVIFSLIVSLITTVAIFFVYIIGLLDDKLYKLKGIIYYMGFSFKGFTTYSYIKIIIITFVVITLICAFANFISLISFSSKFLRIVLNLFISTPFFLIGFQEDLGVMLVNLVFYINKNFLVAVIFYIALSAALYIAAKKIFMRIDID